MAARRGKAPYYTQKTVKQNRPSAEPLEPRRLLSVDLFVTDAGAAIVGEYDTVGNTVNDSVVPGLTEPFGVAVSGPDVFVSDFINGTIGEYTTTGTVVNASLVSAGLSNPAGIAVSGPDLFVANVGSGTVGEYTTAGTTVDASLIAGLTTPYGIAVAGSDIFVTDQTDGTIGKYSTSGTVLNATLVTGLDNPDGIAISGSDLFVADGDGTIDEYTTTGSAVSAPLVSGLVSPSGIAVSGSDLFVTQGNTVGEYDISGATLNAALLTGFSQLMGITAATSTATPQLFVTQQPVSALANQTLASIGVDVTDSNGNLLTGDNSNVTLAIASGPNGAVLAGTHTVAASGGVATFSDLSLATTGTYTLTATDGGDTAATTTSFTIAVPALAFNAQPLESTPGVVLAPVTVDIDDPNGNILSNDSSIITLAISSGTTGAVLSGTTSVAAFDGEATFSDLSIAIGGTYTLTATDGTDTPATSDSFDITAPTLAFSTGPVDTTTDQTLSPILVEVDDVDGDLIATDNSMITLAVAGGPDGGALGGTTTVAAVNGVATFTGLSLGTAGTYSLIATDGSYAPTTAMVVILPPYGSGTDNFTLSATQLANNNLYIDYTWPATENDLDTGTEFLGSAVGYGGEAGTPYLDWSRDDTSAGGHESVIVNLDLAYTDGQFSNSTQVLANAGWYSGNDGVGPATITVALQNSSGVLTQQDTKTINPGRQDDLASTLVDTITINVPFRTIGGLDPNFGNSGLAPHDVGFTSTGGVAADGAQSVVVGPIGTSPDESFGVTRYNGDGSLDTSFGSGGVVSTSVGGTDDVPSAVDVLPGGQILVAGTAATYADGVASGSEFAVAEYNPDGSLDAGFGSGGEMLVSFSTSGGMLSNDVLKAMAIGAGNVIYLGGSSDANGNTGTDFALAALNFSGAIDTGFGTGGEVLKDFAGGDDVINSLAIQPKGDIVAAGSATIGGIPEVALARFLPTGSLDPHFGSKGIVTTGVRGVDDSAASVLIEPKGQIVIGGSSATGSAGSLSTDFLLAGYTAAGKLDRTFGSGGITITSFGQPAAVTKLVLQADGGIVASGKTTASLTDITVSDENIAIARYTAHGILDTSFNGTGKTIIDLSADQIAGADAHTVSFSETTIEPLDTSNQSMLTSLTNSDQGVVAVTPSGELVVAGNNGLSTVEAELIAAGVNLMASLLGTVPAAVTGGAKGTATVQIVESGTDLAAGTITIVIEVATNAGGGGATMLKSLPEKISLRPQESKSYKVAFVYSGSLTAGNYYLVADLQNGTSASLQNVNTQIEIAASKSVVDIAPPFISLTGSGLTTAATLFPGKTATLMLTITNAGNVAAKGTIMVDLTLSPDDGSALTPVKLPVSLAANKMKVCRLSFELPTSFAAGSYYLMAVVDPLDSLGAIDQTDATLMETTPVNVGG